MHNKEEKLARLVKIAKMYYLENQKQSDIAKAIGVSRPFVSRMLQEAMDAGIVEITIREPESLNERIFRVLKNRYGLEGGAIASDGENDIATNKNLSLKAIELIEKLGSKRIGVGWGHFVGFMIEQLEKQESRKSTVYSVCPLIGNAGLSIRNYQTNENVRIMAVKLDARPYYLDLPALPADFEEKELLCSTNAYRLIEHNWRLMDTALVNIGNYPSTPDFASGARYGMTLQNKRACGRLVAYYFNEQGEIMSSDRDFAIQIPMDILEQCKNVVGLCSANTSLRAMRGALETGLLTHIIARKDLITNLNENEFSV